MLCSRTSRVIEFTNERIQRFRGYHVSKHPTTRAREIWCVAYWKFSETLGEIGNDTMSGSQGCLTRSA